MKIFPKSMDMALKEPIKILHGSTRGVLGPRIRISQVYRRTEDEDLSQVYKRAEAMADEDISQIY